MYTIKRAAELTGVPEFTLRAWQKRYAIVTPARSDGGYRLYSDADIALLSTMGALVRDGWSPSQAATELLRSDGDSPRPVPTPRADAAADSGVPAATGDGVAPPSLRATIESHRAPDVFPPDIEEFIQAAQDLDSERLARILDDRFTRATFETTVDDWLLPALRSLLMASATGRITDVSEHMATHAVMRRVAMAFEGASQSDHGPRLLVGLAPGTRHELGALSIATTARRAGLSVTYLGRDLSQAAWIQAIEQRQAKAVVIMTVLDLDVDSVNATVAHIHAAHPEVRILIAGRFEDLVTGPVEHLGGRLGEATKRVAEELLADLTA